MALFLVAIVAFLLFIVNGLLSASHRGSHQRMVETTAEMESKVRKEWEQKFATFHGVLPVEADWWEHEDYVERLQRPDSRLMDRHLGCTTLRADYIPEAFSRVRE